MSTGKRMKGVPVHHDELKAKRTINLTDTAWAKVKAMGLEQNISASEVIERWARGEGLRGD
jgi:hypothetical protein